MGTTPKRILEATGIAVILGFLAMLVVSGSNGPHRGRRTQCMSKLRNVALALQTYATNNNGELPPACIADASGRPMHSWRVLLLPYLEQQGLYDRYNFDEPWNGPNNSKLAEFIPDIYQCPEDVSERDAPQPWTSFVAIVGPHSMWPGDKPGTLDRVPDGAANTLLLVEAHNSGIHWMEPRDLHVGQMTMQVNPAAGQGISGPHDFGANVMFADGHGGPLPDDIKPELLRQLIDIDDGGPDTKDVR